MNADRPDARNRLTRQVARRQRLAAAGRAAARCAAGVLIIGLLWLAAARLLSLGPDLPAPPAVLLAAGAGLALLAGAGAYAHRPDPAGSARLIDRRADGQDLFLTAAAIAGQPGDFHGVVLAQAEARAGTVRAAAVVPLRPGRPLARLAALAALLAVAALTLPRVDPLGLGRQHRQLTRQRQRLEETRRATQERAQALQQRPPEDAKVQEAIAKLAETFRQAQPALSKENAQKLAERQQELGALWKQVNDARLKSALQTSRVEQAFGAGSPPEAERWKDALRSGDASALQKEMQDLAKQMEALAARPDSAERRAAQAPLEQQAAAMANAAAKALQSPELNAALARAADQLAQGKNGALSSEALRAAGESLRLGQQELDALAKTLQNMKQLDGALKAAQLARQSNARGQLDGQGTGQCQSMADYAALYQAKLGSGGGADHSPGPGMGPNGQPGAGGHAPENGGAQTAYQTERSPTQLTGGQIDAQFSSQEVSEAGEVRRDGPGALARSPQQVSEAIAAEQVPPGYHAAIQKYFDAAPAPAATPPGR